MESSSKVMADPSDMIVLQYRFLTTSYPSEALALLGPIEVICG